MPDTQHITPKQKLLQDTFGRKITYLRLSVTDRCDLRCTYCMAENMSFLPKSEVLSLEEMLSLSRIFMERGVRRIRLSGGEPLVRKNIIWLFEHLGAEISAGNLDELTLTTNGTQLRQMAKPLYDAGVRRINISLDTLDPVLFKKITRRDQLSIVLDGIEAALSAGLAVKINTVAVKGINDAEIASLLQWTQNKGLDLTLIETMPLGTVSDAREDTYMPLSVVKDQLDQQFTLTPSAYRTGGPARYFTVNGGTNKLGLITPLTNNFCDGCNRMRITCTGRIYMCLGQDNHVDLRAALRSDTPTESLNACIDKALGEKPKRHDFAMTDGKMQGKISRPMSQTGG